MSDAAFDLDTYLQRIGLSGPVEATLDALARIVDSHSKAIAFENIDVLAGRVPALDLDSLQRKLVRSGRGGYCFEQNALLMACLQHIGFEVCGLEARVRSGVPADVVTGRTHMALRVTIDGVDHHADVGFGGMAPTAPLRCDSRAEQRANSAVYRFVDVGGEVLLQARGEEGWSDCYQVGHSEPHPIDYDIGNWFVATNPRSMLGNNLLVGRAIEGGRLTLFNRDLTRRVPETGAPLRRTLETRDEFASVLRDDFGLTVSEADLDAVMNKVERATSAGAQR